MKTDRLSKNHLTPKDIFTLKDRFNYVVNREDTGGVYGDLSEYRIKAFRAGPGVFRIEFRTQLKPNKGAKKHVRQRDNAKSKARVKHSAVEGHRTPKKDPKRKKADVGS